MTPTKIWSLVWTGLFCAAAAAILTWGFYERMVEIPVTVSVTLWAIAILCLVLGRRVRQHLEDGSIGMDRSQLNPVTAARWLVIGRAAAWTGAIVGGAYLGIAGFVIPQSGILDAAANDVPGVLASSLGGIAASAAGVYLERGCITNPPEGVAGGEYSV